MPDLPVKCVRCGTTGFTANLIGGTGNVSGLTLRDVTMGGACPKCGGDMRVLDGTYDFTGGVMSAFRALDATRLQEIQSVLRDSRERRVDPQAATAQVAALSPDVAALITTMQQQGRWNSPPSLTRC